MARIPESEIERLKNEVSVQRLVETDLRGQAHNKNEQRWIVILTARTYATPVLEWV